ncbi:MAG: hypothetical protein ACOX1G_09425 [bacterium]
MIKRILITVFIALMMAQVAQAIADEKNAVAIWELNEGKGETAVDSGAGKNNGVIHNAQWVQEGNETALYFNGENSYISVSGPGEKSILSITKELKIELNLKLESYLNKKASATGSKNGRSYADASDQRRLS